MNRTTRRRLAASVATAALVLVPVASAQADASSVLTATAVAGTLTVTGAGTATGNVTPGLWSALTGATLLTVADLRGTTAGWHVTAQYQAPTVGLALGGANIKVSTGNPTGDALSNLAVVSGVTLATPATVLSTYGTGTTALSGAGVSTADASFEVLTPSTAQLGDVYGGTVVFTVTSG